MESFEYAAPESLDEVLGLLENTWGKAEVLAGGTDLVTCLKQNLTAPRRLVSLKNVKGLRDIRIDGETVHIGAMTPLRDLIGDKTLRGNFPALVTAAEEIGSAQIKSVGTVGGDLCQRPRCWYFRNGHGLFGMKDGASLVVKGDNRYHAIFGTGKPPYFVSPSSLAPALVALDGTVVVRASAGGREIQARDFFRKPENPDERETALRPNEVVTAIRVPLKGLRNATYEVRHRHGLDWPYVTASVAFKTEDGSASDGKVILGHVAPTPWYSAKASASLSGKIDAGRAQKCGEAAIEGAEPMSGNRYKVQLAKVAVKRAVLAAAGIS